jgi:ribosomal protein S18 acetylase RimI-like enzyme
VSAASATSGSELVRGLQERAARALPAEHVRDVGGWWLRHAPDSAWWAGSVLPHGDAPPGELRCRVVGAEEFYARHGAVTRFQISPGACPEGLDAVLAARGYRRESAISLQVASAARVLERAPIGSLRVRLDDRPTPAWFESWHAVHGHGGDSRSEWDMLGRVDRPGAYACAMAGDAVVAVGRAVADTGWAGVFGMATLPEARGKGAARSLLAALAGWAGAHDADQMYLQVEHDNTAALRLYERAGFREVCRYHYRSSSAAIASRAMPVNTGFVTW